MASRGRILIVDDEANARAALSEILREEGYSTETAADGFKALGKLEEFQPDVVLTDLKMPGLDGIGLMEKAQATRSDATFVVMTAFGSISNAVEAVKKGAYNYLTKPLDFSVLAVVVERAVERSRLLQENSRLRDRLRERNAFGHVIGSHPSMVKLLRLVEQVAPSRASVLILGETGTGKELIAEMIHRASPRGKAPLVRLNCAALSESLLESELFGHEKGAFTGAIVRREGRFELAAGGTVFLDEVSEIPLPTQVKLLRFLQERTFERVGGNETLKVDVRILAASNRDLRERIAEGLFREDLYYRLNVVTLEIPPLRERVSDIPELAVFFLRRYAQENGKRIESFSDEALRALAGYGWPGNVRELENAVERAVVLCDGPRVEARHLPASIHAQAPADVLPSIPGTTIYDLERFAILRTLEACKGSTSKAATILGISPRKIQYKLHEYGSSAPAHHDPHPPGARAPAVIADEPPQSRRGQSP
jgi:DNA-binding NtrC family response regulator